MEKLSSRPHQLALDLGLAPALGRDDFIDADNNRLALDLVERWPDWPTDAALLIGPPGSGKTHLAAIWRAHSGAAEVSAARLGFQDVPHLLAGGACVIEDLCRPGIEERALFHLLNLAVERRASLLLTSRRPAAALDLTLPDLKSRLMAVPTVEIGVPNDSLLRLVLVKLLVDRQLVVDPEVVDYLVSRMERSLGMAGKVVERIDALAAGRRRPISRPLAARALEQAEKGEAGDE